MTGQRCSSDDAPSGARLLYLITSPMSSGFLRGQLRHLMDQGYDVVVGVGSEDGVSGRFDDGVVVVSIPFVRVPRLWADMRALVSTIRLIRRVRPNLVNASTPKAGLLGMVAAFVARVPVRVYVVRGLRFETARGLRSRLLRLMERVALCCATHAVFNSPSLQQSAERAGVIRAGRGEVLASGTGNGVDPTRFSELPDRRSAREVLGVDDDAEVVGFVGRLTRDKGADDLIDAFSALAATRPRLRLLVVGRVEAGDPLRDTTLQALRSDPRIAHVAWLDSPGSAYRAMDILLFPSYREGMPNVPLEAQLCGVPVVGYAATGTVDAVRHGQTGVLVDVGDTVALADAVKALLDSPRQRAEMAAAGRAWVEATFTPALIWAELSDRYRRWLAPGRRRTNERARHRIDYNGRNGT